MTQQEFESILAGRLEETSNPSNHFETGSRVINTVIQGLIEQGCQHAEFAEPAARNLFNRFVRPFDIPGLPNIVIEPRVDDALEEAVAWAVRQAVDRLCSGEDTTDGPTIVAR